MGRFNTNNNSQNLSRAAASHEQLNLRTEQTTHGLIKIRQGIWRTWGRISTMRWNLTSVRVGACMA